MAGTIFTAFLLERKLLFVSEEAGRLCTVIEAFCGLLFPFKWFHVRPSPGSPAYVSLGIQSII